jgi:hypothetical protein
MKVSWLKRVTRIEMLLRDVLYISYCLPVSVLRPLVPACLPLRLVGEDKGFLSIVIINCQNVHLGAMPFPRFNYNQLNLRTYVLNPESGRPAVYFLKSGVTSPVISALTRGIGIPWQRIKFETQSSVDSGNHLLEIKAVGTWQKDFKIIAGRDFVPLPNISPFDNITSAVDFLIRPLEGYFYNGTRLGHIMIQHPEITPQFGALKMLDFPLLNEAVNTRDIVPEKPQSVFFVDKAHFFIYMPPGYITIKA